MFAELETERSNLRLYHSIERLTTNKRLIKVHIALGTYAPAMKFLVQLMNLFAWINIVFFSFTNT